MTLSKQFVLLGHPVGHSVSPAIHQAAYRELGESHDYSLVDCPDEAAVAAQVQRLRRGEIAGANVTVPWKRVAFDLADDHDVSARETGVANVLACDSAGRLVASNTDALALATELKHLRGQPPSSAFVIGAGGAAQAAVVACRSLGVPRIAVTRRSWLDPLRRETWNRAEVFMALGASATAWPAGPAGEEGLDAAARADVIVQATSAGMEGAGPGGEVSDWVPFDRLPPGAVAYDVVYNPQRTPFLAAAERAGVASAGGLGMLVRQAAEAIRIWLGRPVPIEPLSQAARAAILSRGAP